MKFARRGTTEARAQNFAHPQRVSAGRAVSAWIVHPEGTPKRRSRRSLRSGSDCSHQRHGETALDKAKSPSERGQNVFAGNRLDVAPPCGYLSNARPTAVI